MTGFAYDQVFPVMPTPGSVTALKWSLATVLILPQSILLGMTFPLMSAGLLRLFPQVPGGSIALLYFTNSLGAALGVLASGFWLISRVGLPGTILTAGLLNIALAVVVWLLARRAGSGEPNRRAGAAPPKRRRVPGSLLLLSVSLLTGASSFMYEIGWIRALSLMLGSSSHAFELMLSAFILGLALGGLWIRGRIDRLGDGTAFLGWVQLAMGLLALGSVAAYGQSFDLMKEILGATARTDAGYVGFNLASRAIAMMVMLPAAFCAGMTLPLITFSLLRRDAGEGAIGSVYAANTVGAILGVVLSVHVFMPWLGLKGLVVLGASIDLLLGVALLRGQGRRGAFGRPGLALAGSVAAVVATLVWVELDPYKMASGVYRNADFIPVQTYDIVFHRDGKTATVDVIRSSGVTAIRTNGKSDAAIRNRVDGPPSPDEVTMIFAAALPLAMRPEARTAANIGFGSGLTTHTLLGSAGLERVDTIEIEQAMVEGASHFRPRVERAFSDPRSRVVIEDAKTFFASRRATYDIIVSEPSNPWVSGVASLFTTEFYRLAKRHLAPGGLFVQWMQLYESNPALMSSVLQAIAENFSDYAIYSASSVDALIIATRDGRLPRPTDRVFQMEGVYRELARVGINGPADIELRRAAGRELLQAFTRSLPVPVNSDYFLFLDQQAPRARFLDRNASAVVEFAFEALPVGEMLEAGPPPGVVRDLSWDRMPLKRAMQAHIAWKLQEALVRGTSLADLPAGIEGRQEMELIRAFFEECGDTSNKDVWLVTMLKASDLTAPHLPPAGAAAIWKRYERSPCYGRLSDWHKDWILLFASVAGRDPHGMSEAAERLLEKKSESGSQFPGEYLVVAAMTGRLALDDRKGAQEVWDRHGPMALGSGEPMLLTRILLALARVPQGAANEPHGASAADRTSKGPAR